MNDDTFGCLFVVALVLVVVSLGVGLRVAFAEYLYGDPRCAFAECRIEVGP